MSEEKSSYPVKGSIFAAVFALVVIVLISTVGNVAVKKEATKVPVIKNQTPIRIKPSVKPTPSKKAVPITAPIGDIHAQVLSAANELLAAFDKDINKDMKSLNKIAHAGHYPAKTLVNYNTTTIEILVEKSPKDKVILKYVAGKVTLIDNFPKK